MESIPVATAEQGAALKRMLLAHGFTTEGVCRRTEFPSIYDFRSIRDGRTSAVALSDPLDLLIRLFMDVVLVDRGTIESMLPPAESGLLEGLGLIRPLAGAGRRWHATVLLYPTESIWIASDLNASPTDTPSAILEEDAVYPAITKNTRHFLGSLPSTPCGAFLELCARHGGRRAACVELCDPDLGDGYYRPGHQLRTVQRGAEWHRELHRRAERSLRGRGRGALRPNRRASAVHAIAAAEVHLPGWRGGW